MRPVGAATGDAAPAPSRGPLIGLDGTAGPEPASTPGPSTSEPRLNLSLPGTRGRPGLIGAPGVLPVLPPPPERKAKITEELDKAGRADCRKAYSDMGLLGAVPLAIDAVKGTGCKW